MSDPIKIVEIGKRPPTGVSSRPFRCLGDDGHSYYVKLGTALANEKICEWIFGFLARELGLPTPEAAIVSVEKGLSQNSIFDTSEFGHGIGYGSREIKYAHDLVSEDLHGIEKKLRAEILIFDWWIFNEDRKFGEFGGNPNILVTPNQKISIIDHGNALDPGFDEVAFFDDHVFRDELKYWQDQDVRDRWVKVAMDSLANIEDRWKELSDVWLEDSATLSLDRICKKLKRISNKGDEFWQPFL